MIIGYLVLSFCVATLSAAIALLSGYGILATLGFYILGGCLCTMAAAAASLCYRLAHQPKAFGLQA